ncbi:MAG: DNA translocase FtsK, partial [Chloracidobacterium sp.]|nr:DNA translocase FtsK [Chloracidobacterium sp.]
EIIGLILIGIGIVILLALLSYDSSDPSWNSVSGNTRAHNLIGPMGAKVSDALYQAFGIAALIVPLMLFIIGRWQWDDDESEVSKPKILGLFLMIVAFTGWVTLFGPEKPLSFYWGGFVGQWLMYGRTIGLARLLGGLGAFVALVILFTTGLLLGTDYTLIGLIDNWSRSRPNGVVAEWANRLRLKKQLREPQTSDVVQPGHVYAKFDQRKRANRPGSVGGGMRVTVRPGVPAGRKQIPAIIQPRQAEREIGAGVGESLIEAGGVVTAEEAPKSGPQSARGYHDGRERPARIPPSLIRGQSRYRSGDENENENENQYEDEPDRKKESREPIGSGDGEYDMDDPSSQRSVDEMMATASVKRVENAEALIEKEDKGAKSKIGRLVKTISRVMANYKLPSTEMLTPPAPRSEMAENELMERARQLAEKCAEFNVSGQVKQISPGPVVTTFEFKPDPGVKYSRITSLVDDLCLALQAESVRIDRIPGKSTVGIEVPNAHREMIRLREVLESKRFHESKSKLTLALGKTIDGANYVADLAKMPHLLIAGATGAGKSVALNTILASLLYKSSPEEVKLILIDPKRLELGLYADIPHLLSPIVTDPKRASYALKWAVAEMESRYKRLASFGVRNIEQFNIEIEANSKRVLESNGGEEAKALPYIVVIIDELADLMMVSARDVEESITRLAQMARAVGIHLVLATQRPSVDVITGLIKANFPSRISFRVSSKVDSRTIIDSNGAEQLLGQGDMLFLPPGTSRLVRVHGAYVDEKEVKRIADFVRSQGIPAYDEQIGLSEKELQGDEFGDLKKDEKYDEAVRIVIEMGRASTSVLQRRLRIGYGRAASIIDMMEREGIVGPEDGSKPRQVLVKSDFLERLDQMRDEGDI